MNLVTESFINDEIIDDESVFRMLEEIKQQLKRVADRSDKQIVARAAVELGLMQTMFLSAFDHEELEHYWISQFWANCEAIGESCPNMGLKKLRTGRWKVSPYYYNLECVRQELPLIDFLQLTRAMHTLTGEVEKRSPHINGSFTLTRNPYYQHRFDFSWLKERADE